jgi:hypothetical protein
MNDFVGATFHRDANLNETPKKVWCGYPEGRESPLTLSD